MKVNRLILLSMAILAMVIQVSAQTGPTTSKQGAQENKWESLTKFMQTLFAAYFPLNDGMYDNAKASSEALLTDANALKSDMPAMFNKPEVLKQIDALTASTKAFDDAVKANESDSILVVKLTNVKKLEGDLITLLSKNAK